MYYSERVPKMIIFCLCLSIQPLFYVLLYFFVILVSIFKIQHHLFYSLFGKIAICFCYVIIANKMDLGKICNS